MITERKSGILLHVTSLPSYGGIGDFGPAAYGFIEFLASAKQRVWQVLPLNPTGFGNSPYAALSAFAGNALLISLERLVQDGWLYQGEIGGLAGHGEPADFDRAGREKLPLIERAAKRFIDSDHALLQKKFEGFCRTHASWLDDYVRYQVLRKKFDYLCWCDWPKEFAARDEETLKVFDVEYAEELQLGRAIQFFFDEQWCALKSFCASRDVSVMGDMAIFVNYDSADVWTNRDVFQLDEEMKPIVVSGVPPDYFSETGQRWGNPLYDWKRLEKQKFAWWVERVRRQMQLYDVLRLDHFRGFDAYWEIQAFEETAINGKWVEAPGQKLFERLKSELGELPFIAEDLGLITQTVEELREHFKMPGMRVLQFGFSDRGAHMHLPHRFVSNMVAYTGTHDNNTTLGWWREQLNDGDRLTVQDYLGPMHHPNDIVWAMIRSVESSVAALCIVPLQDLLHLGSEGRMNTPADPNGNWVWRYSPDALHPDLAHKLATITTLSDRDNFVPVPLAEDIEEITTDESQTAAS